MCDTTHKIHARRDSFTYAARLSGMCNITHWHVLHALTDILGEIEAFLVLYHRKRGLGRGIAMYDIFVVARQLLFAQRSLAHTHLNPVVA